MERQRMIKLGWIWWLMLEPLKYVFYITWHWHAKKSIVFFPIKCDTTVFFPRQPTDVLWFFWGGWSKWFTSDLLKYFIPKSSTQRQKVNGLVSCFYRPIVWVISLYPYGYNVSTSCHSLTLQLFLVHTFLFWFIYIYIHLKLCS